MCWFFKRKKKKEKERKPLPPDVDGVVLNIYDDVKVIREENYRAGKRKYNFCSKGKTGKVVGRISKVLVYVIFPLENGKTKKIACQGKDLRFVKDFDHYGSGLPNEEAVM